MKKFISFVSILLMLSITFSLAGCSAKEPVGDPPEANGQDYFNAEVLDVLDNQIKVRCLDVTTGAITEGTELSVTTKVSSANEVPEMEVGDHIRVVFTGVMETDPPRLQTVFSIWKIDENGEVLSGASFPQPIEPEKADCMKEVRYTSLQKAFPAEAEQLFEAAEENAKWRYNSYINRTK